RETGHSGPWRGRRRATVGRGEAGDEPQWAVERQEFDSLARAVSAYGPEEGWPSAYPECRERNQSPINILDHDAKVSLEYQELTLEGFGAESSNKTSMKNTGKTGSEE
ncbi:hypothetical protein NHX12_030365, partial [Muraenolepis orangiensis]